MHNTDKDLAKEVSAVLKAHQAKKHVMGGGTGVSCFVWVNGNCVSSENCIEVKGLEAALQAIPGVHRTKINYD